MPKASTPPAQPPNRNAPTPSTRLLPSYPQPEFFELNPPATPEKPQTPVPRYGRARIFDFRGVLVLARPSDREDGTLRTGTPEFSAENPWQVFGNPRTYLRKQRDTGTAWRQQCRTTGLMRSERRALASHCLMRAGHVGYEKTSRRRHP